ncbi:hypothetical protein THAOC_30317, partial [Thalassiosira oceanica]
SGKTTWEPVSTSTSTATPCFRAEISGSEPPGTPQIQRVYGAMNPLVAYALAPMHLAAFHTPRGSGKTTWEPVSTSTSTATPCFRAEISGFEPPGTPQIQQVYGAMNLLLVYTLAPMHLPAFHIPRASGKTTWEPTSTSTLADKNDLRRLRRPFFRIWQQTDERPPTASLRSRRRSRTQIKCDCSLVSS